MKENLSIVYENLYNRSKCNEYFTNLKSLILDKSNIICAYHNLKMTIHNNLCGIDKITIKTLEQLSIDQICDNVYKLINIKYQPKPVITKQIVLKNGHSQYIGIPSIWDYLIQQCIKQVLEPICEAKFSKRNYSLKPNCKISNIISVVYNRLQLNKIYNVLELDINTLYQNINHSKLIKQIWALGIHDKWLIYQLKCILLTPLLLNKKMVYQKCGIIQSGILAPLLLNIALNEFDHWIDNQWEENPIVYKYSTRVNKNNIMNKGHGYRAMRNTNLKELYLVRYNDQIRIFVKKKQHIERIKYAIINWFSKRLKYNNININVIDTHKNYFEFLGFKIKTELKHHKYVVKSHINDFQFNKLLLSLKQQIRYIQHPRQNKTIIDEIYTYNNIVFRIHTYYNIATHISNDCGKFHNYLFTIFFNRLKGLKTTGNKLTSLEQKYYGNSTMLKYYYGKLIYPIGYIRHQHPIGYKFNIDFQNNKLLFKLLKQSVKNDNIQLFDNKIQLFIDQSGKCAILNKPFNSLDEIHCHHKIPKCLNGTDDYDNLILINNEIHILIHAKNDKIIQKYLLKYSLNNAMINKINQLRKLVNNNSL